MLNRLICKITDQLVLPNLEKMLSNYDITFLISSYLSPEDIFKLIKMEGRFEDIICAQTSEANFFWKKKFEKHFPNHISFFQKAKQVHWYAVFTKVYNEYYKNLSSHLKKLFSLEKEEDFHTLKIQHIFPDDLMKEDKYGNSLLSLAKKKNNQSLLDYFFSVVLNCFKKNMISVEEDDDQGRNIFHWAIYCRQSVDVINELIRLEAPVQNTDGYYRSPLFLAAEDGLDGIVRRLLGEGVPIFDNDLCIAAKNGHYEVVESLLNNGANVNAKYTAYQGQDEPAVYLAAQNGHVEIVKLFLRQQADVNLFGNQENENNGTALHIAVCNGHRDVVILLLAYPQTNIDAETSFGATALILAVGKGDESTINLLLARNANLSKGLLVSGTIGPFYLKAGNHVLHMAALLGNLSLIKLLFDRSPTMLLTANNSGQLPADIAHENVKAELKLLEYSLKREKKGNFIYSFNFFHHEITLDFDTRPNRAFSKEEKLAAAKTIINIIFGDHSKRSSLEQHWPALKNGDLGRIFSALQKKYPFLSRPVENKQPKGSVNMAHISCVDALFHYFSR